MIKLATIIYKQKIFTTNNINKQVTKSHASFAMIDYFRYALIVRV